MRERAFSRYRRPIVSVCLILLTAGLLWFGFTLSRLWKAATAVQADLRALESLTAGGAQNVDAKEAVRLLYSTRADLEALHDVSRPFLRLAPFLGWLPRYGADIQAAPALLEIALSLTSAAQDAVEPLFPFLVKVTGEAPPDQGNLLAEALIALDAVRPQLSDALLTLREAQATRTGIADARLSPRVRGWVAQLDRFLPVAERGIVGGLVLPEVLGAGGSRTYLILVQNEDELRATGGFISGVARVTFTNGMAMAPVFEDSYAVDDLTLPYPDPPDPLLEYMLTELWLFRDSNWSPDFPTSAQTAIDLYAISRNAEVDGVIALDQRAIQVLIEAVGPLYVEGAPEPVTGENAIHIARQAWNPGDEASDDWWQHRKDIMSAVLSAAVRRLEQGMTQSNLIDLGSAVLQILDERHLLVYLGDQETAARLTEVGWDGAILQDSGDYVMVVDTNVGFNKVNALVEERLEYAVDLSDLERPQATLRVRHAHTLQRPDLACTHQPRYDETYEQLMERCYWDYLRAYVPAGSRLLDATPHAVAGTDLLSGRPSPAQVTSGPSERGRDVFATLFLLRPTETLEMRFDYALPEQVLRRTGDDVEYDLLVQKQAGTGATPLHVQVTLPPGMAVSKSEPQPTRTADSRLEYVLTLVTDQRVSLSLHPVDREAP